MPSLPLSKAASPEAYHLNDNQMSQTSYTVVLTDPFVIAFEEFKCYSSLGRPR